MKIFSLQVTWLSLPTRSHSNLSLSFIPTGHCFDDNQYPLKRGLFCPFAHRLPPPEVATLAKDLANEYHYLGNTSEWFFLARKNAEKVIARNEQYIKGNSNHFA
jgi:hypothetical protein